MVPLIARKRDGGELSADQLRYICRGAASGELPDYQIAAWLMAVYLRGMSSRETLALTRAMVATGETLDWSGLGKPAVDKHSTGGVGDKTSLVLVPLIAAAGLPFVKMSGRGLGHTGGTLDKLEAIPGFRVNIALDAVRAQVRRIGCALVGQSPKLVPADGALYALRDVTATVDALPLIASSIMSKKLAGGASKIILDVKYGSGAFMPDVESARKLARAMVAIGRGAERATVALLSSMEEPLGQAVGNALETREAIETLTGGGPADLWELALELGSHLMVLAGSADSLAEGNATLAGLRDSGAAAGKFAELIDAQGGDARVVRQPELLPRAAYVETVLCDLPARQWVAKVDARAVANVALALGAGRRSKTDALDLSVGVRLLATRGDALTAGAPLAEIHATSADAAASAEPLLRSAFQFSDDPVAAPLPDFEIVRGEDDSTC